MQSEDSFLKRARNLVAMIAHAETGEYEALNAFRAFKRWGEKHGVELDTLRFAPASAPCPYARERIEDLEQAKALADEKIELQSRLIAGFQARVDALGAQLAALRADEPAAHAEPDEQTDHDDDPAVDAGLVPLGAIVDQIAAKTSRKHWTTAAAHALAMPVAKVRAWFTLDIMPATLAHKLASLSAEDLKPASRKRWSDSEVRRLKALVARGLDNVAIAQKLSREFGRRIFEGGIGRIRSKLVMAGRASQSDALSGYGAAPA